MRTIAVSVVILPLFIIALLIPVLIGVYVYRDANRRGMNAALWTVVAVLAPSLIGFIIYLLARGNYSDLKCPQCSTAVTEKYVICPRCGAKLRPACPNCSTPVETDWRLCPSCTAHLPQEYADITEPVRPKDRALWKILVAVIVIPVLLIVLMIFLFGAVKSGGASSAMGTVTADELYSVQGDTYVAKWIEELDKDSDKAYALEYIREDAQGGEEYFYLLYVPANVSDGAAGMGVSHGGLFYDVLRIDMYSGETDEEMFYCICSTAEKDLELEIYIDDVKMECEITQVDFNPTVFLTEDSAYEELYEGAEYESYEETE